MIKSIKSTCIFLFLGSLFSCNSQKVEQNYYPEYAFYHHDQIANFEGALKLHLEDEELYNKYFKYPPRLTSNTLPTAKTNPGSWFKGEGHLAEKKLMMKFGITSNTSVRPDTIMRQIASIEFRKSDTGEDIFWIPVGILDTVDINSDLMHIAQISWEAKLDENKELAIDLKLSNQINFRWGDEYILNHQINTLYGFNSDTNYLKIPVQHLSIKSSEGNISFYTNTSNDDFKAVWKPLKLSGQVVKTGSLVEYEQEDYNYRDLAFYVSLNWIESS